MEEGYRWADPDPAQAAAYLRILYENPDERARMARESREYICREYSLACCGERMRERLGALRNAVDTGLVDAGEMGKLQKAKKKAAEDNGSVCVKKCI